MSLLMRILYAVIVAIVAGLVCLLAGTILCEIEVTWPDGKTQTFPVDGYFRVEVIQDLG